MRKSTKKTFYSIIIPCLLIIFVTPAILKYFYIYPMMRESKTNVETLGRVAIQGFQLSTEFKNKLAQAYPPGQYPEVQAVMDHFDSNIPLAERIAVPLDVLIDRLIQANPDILQNPDTAQITGQTLEVLRQRKLVLEQSEASSTGYLRRMFVIAGFVVLLRIFVLVYALWFWCALYKDFVARNPGTSKWRFYISKGWGIFAALFLVFLILRYLFMPAMPEEEDVWGPGGVEAYISSWSDELRSLQN